MNANERDMTNRQKWGVAPLPAVAAFCLFAALCGCGKRPESVSAPPPPPKPAVLDRMQDPVYTNALMEARREQVARVRRAEPVLKLMDSMKARARKALPQGATEARVLEELDAHPAKYPGWRELRTRAAELEREQEKGRREARALVRARILQEAADRKAAAK